MKFSQQTIRDFFRSNRAKGVDLKRDMLWGFFFVDKDASKLAALEHDEALLEDLSFVGLLEADASEPLVFAHLEHVATHSIESLYETCLRLHEYAEAHGIASFDGFDVGNVDGSALHE